MTCLTLFDEDGCVDNKSDVLLVSLFCIFFDKTVYLSIDLKKFAISSSAKPALDIYLTANLSASIS